MVRLFDLYPQDLRDMVIQNRISKNKNSKFKANTLKKLENLDFAFESARKLPLLTKRNVLSAISQVFNVKGVTLQEISLAVKKIIEKADQFGICTMGLKEEYERYLSNSSKDLKN